MSRTQRGSKGPGYEYWGRRPTKYHFQDPGRITKKNTHKMERAQAKKEVRDEKQDRTT